MPYLQALIIHESHSLGYVCLLLLWASTDRGGHIPLESLLDLTLLTDTREPCSIAASESLTAHGFEFCLAGARSHEQWTRM